MQGLEAWRRRPGSRWVNLLVDGGVTAGVIAVVGVLIMAMAVAIGSSDTFSAWGDTLSGDFLTNVAAGRMVLMGDGPQLYSADAISSARTQTLGASTAAETNPFLLPPVAAVFFAGFALVPFPAAAFIWAVASAGLMLASVRVLWLFLPASSQAEQIFRTAAMAGTWPVALNLLAGQNGALWLAIYTFGLRFLARGNPALAGLILGLGAVKPQLFLGVPVLLLVQRRWRALASFVATAAVLASASVVIVGLDGARAYAALISSDYYREALAIPSAWRMISIPAFVRGLAPAAVDALTIVVVVLGLIALGYAVRRAPLGAAYAATVLVSVAVAPHCFAYDGLVLAVPVMVW